MIAWGKNDPLSLSVKQDCESAAKHAPLLWYGAVERVMRIVHNGSDFGQGSFLCHWRKRLQLCYQHRPSFSHQPLEPCSLPLFNAASSAHHSIKENTTTGVCCTSGGACAAPLKRESVFAGQSNLTSSYNAMYTWPPPYWPPQWRLVAGGAWLS